MAESHTNVPPAITVVIPVHNGEAFIARALNSVLNQTVPALEILVVDDCSTDRTPLLVEQIASSSPAVILTRNESNQGPSNSRNRALRLSRGNVVAFLDADDLWLPEHLEAISGGFAQFPQASVAFARSNELAAWEQSGAASMLIGEPLSLLLEHNPICQSAAAVRTAEALTLGGYRDGSRYAEDYDLWMRFALAGAAFVAIPRVTAIRTLHPDQVSIRNAAKMYVSAWGIRRYAIEQHFGSVRQTAPEAVQALLRTEQSDIDAALNGRSRELVRVVIESTSWIPAPAARVASTKRLIGALWPCWRTIAWLYDLLPDAIKRWRNERRRQRARG